MITITVEISTQTMITICIASQNRGIGWRSMESIMMPSPRGGT